MMVVWNIRELTNTTLSDSEFCESWSICILTDRRGRRSDGYEPQGKRG